MIVYLVRGVGGGLTPGYCSNLKTRFGHLARGPRIYPLRVRDHVRSPTAIGIYWTEKVKTEGEAVEIVKTLHKFRLHCNRVQYLRSRPRGKFWSSE